MTFQYEASRRFSFVISLNAEEASSDTVDTGSNGFRFDAYVMGTLGLRAGIRVKVLAGLFSCKLDGIGVQAEVGAYIQLWGYFYYSISNYKDWENE